MTQGEKEIRSKITSVYLNYGIVPVSLRHKERFPTGIKSMKLEVLFDDYDIVHPLTFDPQHNRFFGVKGWYKKHGAKPGDYVIIEPVIDGKRYRFRLAKGAREQKKEILKKVGKSCKKGKGISIVGKPINYGGLVYAPINELGVVLLFGMIFEEIGIIVEEIKSGFPDATIRRFNGRGWTKELVEFEYKSSQYNQHRHPINGCDIIVCWEHDWPESPLEVIELSHLIKLLPRDLIARKIICR